MRKASLPHPPRTLTALTGSAVHLAIHIFYPVVSKYYLNITFYTLLLKRKKELLTESNNSIPL